MTGFNWDTQTPSATVLIWALKPVKSFALFLAPNMVWFDSSIEDARSNSKYYKCWYINRRKITELEVEVVSPTPTRIAFNNFRVLSRPLSFDISKEFAKNKIENVVEFRSRILLNSCIGALNQHMTEMTKKMSQLKMYKTQYVTSEKVTRARIKQLQAKSIRQQRQQVAQSKRDRKQLEKENIKLKAQHERKSR